MGIFYDERGEIIRDPARIQVEREIVALKQKSAAIAQGHPIIDVTPNTNTSPATHLNDAPSNPNRPLATDLPATDNVVSIKRAEPQLTAAERRERSYRPSVPPPTPAPDATPDSTALYLRWIGGGGTGLLTGAGWSLGSHWSRLP